MKEHKKFIAVLSLIEENYRQGKLTKKQYKKACKKLRKLFKITVK